MSREIISHEAILYRHGETTIEGGGFMRPNETKQEEYHDRWYEEDDLKAARGCYGWPLIVGCILSASIVCGVLYWISGFF